MWQLIECPCVICWDKEDLEKHPEGSTVFFGFVWEEVASGRFNYYPVVMHEDEEKPIIMRKALHLVLAEMFVVRGLGESTGRAWEILQTYEEDAIQEEKMDALEDMRHEVWNYEQANVCMTGEAIILQNEISDLQLTAKGLNADLKAAQKGKSNSKKDKDKVDSLQAVVTDLKIQLKAEKAHNKTMVSDQNRRMKTEKQMAAEIVALEGKSNDLTIKLSHIQATQPSYGMQGMQYSPHPSASSMMSPSPRPMLPMAPMPQHFGSAPMYAQSSHAFPAPGQVMGHHGTTVPMQSPMQNSPQVQAYMYGTPSNPQQQPWSY